MIIGICTIVLFIPDKNSLKGKRQVVKSIKDRVKSKYNVSIAEVDDQDLWQKTVLGIAFVGNEKKFVNQVLDSVLGFIRSTPLVEIIDYKIEMV
ncbi:MAG: DUF503 domain-containing protein [Nitrospirota bacterium]